MLCPSQTGASRPTSSLHRHLRPIFSSARVPGRPVVNYSTLPPPTHTPRLSTHLTPTSFKLGSNPPHVKGVGKLWLTDQIDAASAVYHSTTTFFFRKRILGARNSPGTTHALFSRRDTPPS